MIVTLYSSMLPAKKKGSNFHVVFRRHFREVLSLFLLFLEFLKSFCEISFNSDPFTCSP